MIEAKVPKDIRKYKTKIIGPFSFRQIVCIGIALAVDVLLYFLVLKNLPTKYLIYTIMLIDLPIFAFIIEPYGMKMEVFLKTVVIQNFFTPAIRRSRCKLREENECKMTDKEKKKHDAMLKNRLKASPEWKMYK